MKIIQTNAYKTNDPRYSTTHRQGLLAGFDQAKLSATPAVLIGGGGINGEVAEGLCRKGIGRLRVFDHDVVDATNLNRQFFFPQDVGHNKAESLVTNLASHCHTGTLLEGFPISFQDALATGTDT